MKATHFNEPLQQSDIMSPAHPCCNFTDEDFQVIKTTNPQQPFWGYSRFLQRTNVAVRGKRKWAESGRLAWTPAEGQQRPASLRKAVQVWRSGQNATAC